MSTAAIAPVFVHASVKRRKNSWYSIKDGNWTDPNIWLSNGKKRWNYPGQNIPIPQFPQVGDDVYISHSVTVNTALLVVNNIYIAGSLLFDSTQRVFTVYGDLQATGTVNLSGSTHFLALYGANNYITNFNNGGSSTVRYFRAGDQNIMNLSYWNLQYANGSTSPSNQANLQLGINTTKYLTSNLTIQGNLSSSGVNITLELGTYDLTVNGTTTSAASNSTAVLSKAGAGNILFIGLLSMADKLSLSGNPTVELRGGFTIANSTASITTGTGLWTFSTNNQTIQGPPSYTVQFNAPILVSGAITVTSIAISGLAFILVINQSIDGNNAGSTWLNKSNIYFNNATYPTGMLTLGVFDYATYSTSLIGYTFNGSYTLPTTSYQGLVIGGTGTKTLSGTTTIATTLQVGYPSAGALELSTYNLTVTGATALNGNLTKNGAGAVIFIGVINCGSGLSWTLNFSTGNPTVEVRGGIAFNNTGGLTSGTGTWTFSTNNQTISSSVAARIFAGNVVISGAITLTANATVGQSIFRFTGTIDGNNAGSTLDNRGQIDYQNASRPMITGVLQTNAAANTWLYNLNGAQDITGGTYRTLTLSIGGVKTLQGNVVVATLYTLTAPATLNLNGFTRT